MPRQLRSTTDRTPPTGVKFKAKFVLKQRTPLINNSLVTEIQSTTADWIDSVRLFDRITAPAGSRLLAPFGHAISPSTPRREGPEGIDQRADCRATRVRT
jgi:hypothetical protein